MKPNNSLEEDEEMVASDDETLVSEITSLPMDGATKFSDHQDKSKHTPEPVHPKMVQKSQEQHIGGQPEVAENNVFYNKGNAIRASTSWNGTAIHPLTPRSSIDYQPQTLITVPPHTQETLPPPSVLSSDLLQADGLQSPGYQISTIPTSLFLPPLQSSSTDGHCSVFQQDPSYSSQIPYPVVPNTSMAPHPVPGSPHSIMANAASAPVEDNSQFGQSATSSSAIQAQSSADARKAFERLIPFLRTVNSGNLGPLLMSVIKATHDFVSLDELFCMLYSGDIPEDLDTPTCGPPYMTHYSSQQRLMGIKLQYLVRESFRSPQTFQGGLFQHSMLATVNFHEFLRRFLAMKILFGCMQRVNDSSQTLSRLSVYKVYYILCQKLFLKYSENSNSFWLQKHVLGQPKIGVLTKLIYPGLFCKRLGRRGESKVHYIGWTWNESMVDKDTLSLLDLDVPELSEYFEKETSTIKACPSPRSPEPEKGQDITFREEPPKPMVYPFKPLSSFVDISCRFPDGECSPRVWQMASNMVPKQSEWAKVTMQKSVEVLKGHGVNLDPLVARIKAGDFSSDTKSSISGTVIQSLEVLRNNLSSKETYLHLYLAVMLLLLPVIVASDQEVPKVSKAHIRASMKNCVEKLESEVATFATIDKVSLTIFSRSLRKMIHISEMTSCDVKRSDTTSVFKEMISDVQSITNKGDGLSGMSACEDLFITGTIKAINAFSLSMPEPGCDPRHMADMTNIINIGKSLHDVSLLAMRTTASVSSCIDDGMTQKDVAYQVFHLSAKLFHQITLSFPEISQLPIPIITFIILYFTNEMQQVSFAAFARRDPDLSQETFRCWWIFSSMFQEYMGVMSEVVALSQILV